MRPKHVGSWLALITFVVLVAGCSKKAERLEIVSITVEQAAAEIDAIDGKKIVFVFSSGCSRSRSAFPELLQERPELQKDHAVLFYSIDKSEPRLRTFLEGQRASFKVNRIKPWPSGQFADAFNPIGIRIGDSFGLPLVAYLDDEGTTIGQHSGGAAVRKLKGWLGR